MTAEPEKRAVSFSRHTIRAQNEHMASHNPAFAVAYFTHCIQRRFDRCCHR